MSSLTKIQRRAKNRMKSSTDAFSQDRIGTARFLVTYYANFAVGMGAAVLGYRREDESA